MSTESTLAHHLQALGEGVEAVLDDYTDDSVLLTRNGPVRGLDELRTFFEALLGGLPEGFLDAFAILHQEIEGDVAFLVWSAEPWTAMGVDTVIVRDDRIALQTFASHPG